MASRTDMKVFPLLAMLAILTTIHSRVAFTDARSPLEPTALESVVATPGVVLELVEEIGSIRSSDTTLLVAAVIASDTARPGERMQGVHWVMENNTGSDQVYLDESQLASLLRELAGIERGRYKLEPGDSPYHVQGTASCWMPKQPMRILCSSYRIGPDWAGLMLGAFGGGGFEYPRH
jgi:hypothetical protein